MAYKVPFKRTVVGKLFDQVVDQVDANISASTQPYLGGSLGPTEVNPFEKDPVIDFSKTNSSYSGADCQCMVQLNNKLIVLGNVETFSHSIHREKGPVRVLGRSHPKAYVGGCIHKDEPILTKKGIKPVSEIQIGDEILSFDETTKKVLFNRCLNKVFSGIKQTYKITLCDGTEMSLTEEHKVFTNTGWKIVKDLDETDELLIPIDYSIKIDGSIIPDWYLKLLAYGIGDGVFGLYKNGKETRFSLTPGNNDIEIVNEIEQILKENDLLYSKSFRNNCYNIIIKNTKTPTWFQNREYNDFIKWTKTLNIYGKYSHNKIIPDQIFNLSNEQLAIFLSRLFSTDGCIVKHSLNTYRIGYCSTSKKLVYQIKLLLKRFGIHCRIKNTGIHTSKLIVGKHEAYNLTIDGNYVYKFLDKIGVFSKDKKVDMKLLQSTLIYDIKDIKKLKKILKISSKLFPWCAGQEFKRLSSLAWSYEELKENNIAPIVYKEQSKFIKIDEIITNDITDTYDLEIENNHNLFGSFLSHNSRTIAGSIVFIVFDRSPLWDVIKEINYVRNPSDRTTSPLPDQLPPLDLILMFHNEYGHTSLVRLYGVEFIDEGQVYSINDLYSECTMSYVARDMDQMIAYKDVADFKDMMFERQVRGQFIDNQFQGMLDYKSKLESQISECNAVIDGIDMETDRRAVAGVFTLSASYWLSRYAYGKDFVTRDDLNKEKAKQLKIKDYLLKELTKINNQIDQYQKNMKGWNAQRGDTGVASTDYISHAPAKAK